MTKTLEHASKSSRPSGSMRSLLAVAAGTAVVLLTLAPLLSERHALSSIDNGVKLIQSTELARAGFRSMALPYPAQDLDPDWQFMPFESPFVFLSAGRWQSIFSSFYAVLAAALVPHGVQWLVALSIVGGVATVIATTRLPGARMAAGPLLLLATPVWLYAVGPTETALALGCSTVAFAVATQVTGRGGDWAAGALMGVAVLLRDESLLLAPGVLYARYVAGTPLRRLWQVVMTISIPIALMAVVDQWWFERPMLAHLRHAVPGFDWLLPRSRARLPELAVMPWLERVETVAVYWLVGFGGLMAAGLLSLWVGLAHGARRFAPALVTGLIATAAVLHIADLASLAPAPRVLPGLLRLSPFLLLALVPRANAKPPSALARLTWITAGCYLAIVVLTINTAGGKPTGPRLTIGLWPLLAAAAVDTLGSYVAAARRSWAARATALAGLVLVAGSLAMQLAVVLPAHVTRRQEDTGAARLVHALGDQVIVLQSPFDISLVAPLYFDRYIMHAPPAWQPELSRVLAAAPVEHFTFVVRSPADAVEPHFPGYRQAETWAPGRFVISRWVRQPPAPP